MPENILNFFWKLYFIIIVQFCCYCDIKRKETQPVNVNINTKNNNNMTSTSTGSSYNFFNVNQLSPKAQEPASLT